MQASSKRGLPVKMSLVMRSTDVSTDAPRDSLGNLGCISVTVAESCQDGLYLVRTSLPLAVKLQHLCRLASKPPVSRIFTTGLSQSHSFTSTMGLLDNPANICQGSQRTGQN